MRPLIAFLMATQAYGAITYVNSVRCTAATSCATTWNVTAGNVLVVGRWFATGGGTLSDTQSNSYAQLHSTITYRSNTGIHLTTLASGGSTVTVNSTTLEDNLVLAEFSGVSLAVDVSDKYSPGGSTPVCSPSGLSVTTSVPTLMLSIWANDAGGASSCTAITGTLLATDKCGGTTGQLRYQLGTSGTYTQKFTFAPNYNSGSASCGIVALRQTAGTNRIQHRVVSQ